MFAGQSFGYKTKFQNSTYDISAPTRDMFVWRLNTDKVDSCFYNDAITSYTLNAKDAMKALITTNGLSSYYKLYRGGTSDFQVRNQYIAWNSRYSGAFVLLDTMRYPRMCAKASNNMTDGVNYYKGQRESAYYIGQSSASVDVLNQMDNGQVWIFQNGSSA